MRQCMVFGFGLSKGQRRQKDIFSVQTQEDICKQDFCVVEIKKDASAYVTK